MTTTAPIPAAVNYLIEAVRKDQGVDSPDLHCWARDIDESDYTSTEMAESAGHVGELLALCADETGESAADLVARIEYALGW